jgi:putative SOS response-associated peptidase YedK
VFAFAGLYDGTGVAILTTEANEICAPVHDRMPVVLDGPEAEAMWLAREIDVPEAEGLLVPFPSERVSVAAANPAVNRAGVEGPELLTPPETPLTSHSDTLF